MTSLPRPAHASETAYPVQVVDQPDVRPLSLLEIVTILLRRRRLMLLVPLLLAGIVYANIMLRPDEYTSSTTILPTGQRPASSLTGLAAQLGIAIGSAPEAALAPQLVAELMTSRDILHSVADSQYEIRRDGAVVRGTLPEIYQLPSPGSPRARAATIDRLRAQIDARASPPTGLVTLMVTEESPELAQAIAARVVDGVMAFNARTRLERATADREFSETQMADAYRRMRTAENELQSFLITNREYRTSPTLLFEYERLSREAAMRREFYNVVARAYEQVKAEALREAPSLTVVEAPDFPVEPDDRGTFRLTFAALIVGMLLAAMLALLTEYFTGPRGRHPFSIEEFREVRREAAYDLRRPWRLFRRG